jgi:Flp pilus assembly protein TadB
MSAVVAALHLAGKMGKTHLAASTCLVFVAQLQLDRENCGNSPCFLAVSASTEVFWAIIIIIIIAVVIVVIVVIVIIIIIIIVVIVVIIVIVVVMGRRRLSFRWGLWGRHGAPLASTCFLTHARPYFMG